MKELSIEQKAKAYDEAIERAKKWYDANTNEGYRGIFDDIFPELKESKDERVELLNYLYDVHDDDEERARWIAWLEKQGEQKPDDRVEPKFKDGDWVVNKLGDLWHIDSSDKKNYQVSDGKGNYNYFPISKQEEMRLWTIQDAKDGDVLYLQKDGKEHIIIYKGVIKERFRTFVSAYCAYNGIVDAFCFADVSRYVDIAYRGIMPATKEQRDLLFQKMKEAGYEWDAEKKELKKIEQKPAWSEEDENHVKSILSTIECCKAQFPNAQAVVEAYNADIEWLKSIRPQWKPNEEMLEALYRAIPKNVMEISEDEMLLDKLYQGLKYGRVLSEK